MEVFKIILPAVITILGNYIFYCVIKNSVDKSIEDFKISYSGIFKEKIEIYRQCLKYLVDIDYKVKVYRQFGGNELSDEIFSLINSFINYVLVNRPFISNSLNGKMDNLRSKYQSVFDKCYLSHNIKDEIQPKDYIPHFAEALASINTLTDKDFKDLEESMILEMKKELRTL